MSEQGRVSRGIFAVAIGGGLVLSLFSHGELAAQTTPSPSGRGVIPAEDLAEIEARLLRRNRDDLELVRFIRDRIVATSRIRTAGEMKDYTQPFDVAPSSLRAGAPLSSQFEMVAIEGGEFWMGSAPEHPRTKSDEQPRHPVRISPFWMGKHEVTWGLFYPFMMAIYARESDGSLRQISEDNRLADIVSAPTMPYIDMSFGMGQGPDFPAVCMTQHAASKFCQWLSLKTGHFYRLPTEAEWEYACRAGSRELYHFGSDLEAFGDYGWSFENSDDRYHKVGQKKPNAWGLHDMHGNVLEWCLDQYDPEGYRRKGRVDDPIARATRLYPRVARGGSFYDDAADCRAASRFHSSPTWQIQDPELPKSQWYLTDAPWLGFRLVRPLEIPPAEEMHFLWNSGNGARLKESRRYVPSRR